jgi:hypothetical protein
LLADIEAARCHITDLKGQQRKLLDLYAAADEGMPLDVIKMKLSELSRQVTFWETTLVEREARVAAAEQSREHIEAWVEQCR